MDDSLTCIDDYGAATTVGALPSLRVPRVSHARARTHQHRLRGRGRRRREAHPRGRARARRGTDCGERRRRRRRSPLRALGGGGGGQGGGGETAGDRVSCAHSCALARFSFAAVVPPPLKNVVLLPLLLLRPLPSAVPPARRRPSAAAAAALLDSTAAASALGVTCVDGKEGERYLSSFPPLLHSGAVRYRPPPSFGIVVPREGLDPGREGLLPPSSQHVSPLSPRCYSRRVIRRHRAPRGCHSFPPPTHACDTIACLEDAAVGGSNKRDSTYPTPSLLLFTGKMPSRYPRCKWQPHLERYPFPSPHVSLCSETKTKTHFKDEEGTMAPIVSPMGSDSENYTATIRFPPFFPGLVTRIARCVSPNPNSRSLWPERVAAAAALQRGSERAPRSSSMI